MYTQLNKWVVLAFFFQRNLCLQYKENNNLNLVIYSSLLIYEFNTWNQTLKVALIDGIVMGAGAGLSMQHHTGL